MKKQLFFLLALALASLLLIVGNGCRKGESAPINPDRFGGSWEINSVRFSATYPDGRIIDSIVPWAPLPKNYIAFLGANRLEYQFNQPSILTGTYAYNGFDSLTLSLGDVPHHYRISLLTRTNFNISRRLPAHPDFPNASFVMFHQNFVR
jgi:hypothetical protein